MAFWCPALQADNVPLRMLHLLHHPPHHISFIGKILGCLLANDSQDPCDTTKNQDNHWLHLAWCRGQCSTSVGNGWG